MFVIDRFIRIENILGKGENAENQNFFFFLECFQKTSSSGFLKQKIVW